MQEARRKFLPHSSCKILRGGGIELLYFVDNDPRKWGKHLQIDLATQKLSFDIKAPQTIPNTSFDRIILATMVGYNDVLAQLENYGVSKDKIEHLHLKIKLEARINFLRSFAKECKERNLSGEIAEVGVFQGEFAKYMNLYFADKKCFLFDTFEGFDKRDLQSEEQCVKDFGEGHLNDTSVELVMSKMPNPHNVIIKKGYFPQTATGLENESFCFVNLDPDLYEPILAGLEFFYPRLVRGGVILIHDYYNGGYAGVKKAVSEFCEKMDLFAFPIGDDISIAIQKA